MPVKQQALPINILMVEDNAADVDLMKEALKEWQVANQLSIVSNGTDAMSFLNRESRFAHAPRPNMILLDLNLPKKDGREILAEIKMHPDLRRIPTVILTTSIAHGDIMHCYDSHANCYIVKPLEYDQFIHVVKKIEEFWLSTAKLPLY